MANTSVSKSSCMNGNWSVSTSCAERKKKIKRIIVRHVQTSHGHLSNMRPEGFRLLYYNHQILHASVCESWCTSFRQKIFPANRQLDNASKRVNPKGQSRADGKGVVTEGEPGRHSPLMVQEDHGFS